MMNKTAVALATALALSMGYGVLAAQTSTAPPPQKLIEGFDELKWNSDAPPVSAMPDSAKHPSIDVWLGDAPGSEGKPDHEVWTLRPSDQAPGPELLVISKVDKPTLTIYLPPKKIATGAAIVVCPGGGFFGLWITDEGYRVGEWLSSHGIAAFVLKYRLPNVPGSTYTIDAPIADAQRAIRLVRSRATEWGINPKHVGMMGFSAGSMLSGLVEAKSNDQVYHPIDSVDQQSALPDFVGLVYGTPFAQLPDVPPAAHPLFPVVKLRNNMPPNFLVAGADDPVSASYPEVYEKFKAAGILVELHLFAGMGHGFGIQGETPWAVADWPGLFWRWMFDLGMLSK